MAIRPASPDKPPLLVVVGPTASGKTEIAARLAKRLGGELISCDSMQVYRRMPITTQADPSAHLSAFLSPTREFNASLFARRAKSLIAQIRRRKKLPIIVGGTGLYLRALLDGLFDTEGPAQDRRYRARLLKEAEGRPAGYLHEKLRSVDPVRASQVHPNDHRRIIRALEVHHLTRRPMSAHLPRRAGIRDRFRVRTFFLEPDRAELYRRIEKRVDRMIRGGLPAEVRRLARLKLSRTAGMALGVREMRAYLDGTLSMPDAAALLKKNTRHYAKRQLSWFRHERDITTVAVPAGETPALTTRRLLALWRES